MFNKFEILIIVVKNKLINQNIKIKLYKNKILGLFLLDFFSLITHNIVIKINNNNWKINKFWDVLEMYALIAIKKAIKYIVYSRYLSSIFFQIRLNVKEIIAKLLKKPVKTKKGLCKPLNSQG